MVSAILQIAGFACQFDFEGRMSDAQLPHLRHDALFELDDLSALERIVHHHMHSENMVGAVQRPQMEIVYANTSLFCAGGR